MNWEKSTLAFVANMEECLASLTEQELAMQLEELGFSSEADAVRNGEMSRGEASDLIFTSYDILRSTDLVRERHQRRRQRKTRQAE